MQYNDQPSTLTKFKSFQDLTGYLNQKNQKKSTSRRYLSNNRAKIINPEDVILPNLNISNDFNGFNAHSKIILQPYRNSSLKLQSVSHTLNQIQQQLKNLHRQTKETREYKQSLKVYLQSNLDQNRQEAKQQINKLSKLIRTTKHVNSQRVAQIYDDCGALWIENQKMKQQLFDIKIKTQNIEKMMGADNF